VARLLIWYVPQAAAFVGGVLFATVVTPRWGYPPTPWGPALIFGLVVAALYTAAACAVVPAIGSFARLGREARYTISMLAVIAAGSILWGRNSAIGRGMDAPVVNALAAGAAACLFFLGVLLVSVLAGTAAGRRE